MRTAGSPTWTAPWSALTITVLVLLAAACSDGRSDADGTTTTVKRTSTTATTPAVTGSTTTTTTTTPADDPADPVLTTYLAFWDLYIELGGTPPPFDQATVTPRLEELTTGAETEQLFDFLQNNATTGLVLRGEIDHSPQVISDDGTIAVVEDCMDDRLGVYRVADGTRVDTDDPDRHLYTVTLRQESGRWRVETVTMGSEPCTV